MFDILIYWRIFSVPKKLNSQKIHFYFSVLKKFQKNSTNWLERMQKNYIYGIILFEKLTERNTYEFNKIIGKWDVFTETKDRK